MSCKNILQLPNELIELIAHASGTTDLAALARVNHRLRMIANRILYTEGLKTRFGHVVHGSAQKGNLAAMKTAAFYGADLSCPAFVFPGCPSQHRPTWVARPPSNANASIVCGLSWATPLYLAAKNGHGDVAKWLLSQGVPRPRLCAPKNRPLEKPVLTALRGLPD